MSWWTFLFWIYFGQLFGKETACPFGFLLLVFWLWCRYFKCAFFPFGVLERKVLGNRIDSWLLPFFLFRNISLTFHANCLRQGMLRPIIILKLDCTMYSGLQFSRTELLKRLTDLVMVRRLLKKTPSWISDSMAWTSLHGIVEISSRYR